MQFSLVVSAPDSQSGGNGFDPRQRPIRPGLTKTPICLRSVNWYSFGWSEKLYVRPWGGECRVAVSNVPFIILRARGRSVVKWALANSD